MKNFNQQSNRKPVQRPSPNRNAVANSHVYMSVPVNTKNSKSQQFVCTATPHSDASMPVQMTCKPMQASAPAGRVQTQGTRHTIQPHQRVPVRGMNTQPSVFGRAENRQRSQLATCPNPTPSAFVPGGPERQCPEGPGWCALRVEFNQLTVPGSTTIFNACGVQGFDITITTTDGKTITWTATRAGIRVVTVKGGSNANDQNSCFYENNETSDNVPFGAPVNPNGQIPQISHIDFCIDEDVVVLYGLVVTKTADTRFDRIYDWDITKVATGGVTELTLLPGDVWVQEYTVNLTKTFTDSNHEVYGTITITNTNSGDLPIRIDSVTDLVPPLATVVGPPLPYFLPSGQSVQYTYSVENPTGESGVNVATVLATYGSATDQFQASDPWSFEDAFVNSLNTCVDVSDSLFGDLGQICANSTQTSFTYTLEISYPNCGEYEFTNVASFTSLNPDGSQGTDSGSSSWTIDVHVPCVDGCTRTQGYWKTHSEMGPAPYDDTWSQIVPQGANTPFFHSGKTYYQVLHTAPAGNAYYILAHQFIAAQLNLLNGATIPDDVQAAYDQAYDLFNNPTNTPAYIGSLKGNNTLRALFISLANTLEQYNSGVLGPGHCSEQ